MGRHLKWAGLIEKDSDMHCMALPGLDVKIREVSTVDPDNVERKENGYNVLILEPYL